MRRAQASIRSWYTLSPLLLRTSPFFFFNDTATTEIYTLSLHDALPISRACASREPGYAARVIAPMLARLARELPLGDYLYEPKWDGFRCLAFREGRDVDLRSRNGRPLARYFPELVEALLALEADRLALDGEIVVAADAELDFTALLARLHPAS